MDIFKKRTNRNGIVRFFKNGKSIKEDQLPEQLKDMEDGQVEFDPNAEPAYDGPVSVISGEPATRRKFLNGNVYWLTEDEYKNYTLGRLAQFLRESQTVDKTE